MKLPLFLREASIMDFRELTYITAIAHTGNISRAAEELYITQPSLSHFLQQLENQYGLPLFRRVRGRYLPTDAGAAYLAAAQEILDRKKKLDIQLARLQDPDSGSLRVGFSPMRAATLLPLVLPAFRQNYPHVKLILKEEVADTLNDQLGRGELDLCFFAMGKIDPAFEYQVLREEEILLALSPHHPAAAKAKQLKTDPFPFLALESLSDVTFLLLTPQHRLGRHGRAALHRHLPNADVLTLGNLQTVTELAVQGYGAIFLYDSLIPTMGLKNQLSGFCFETQRLTTSYAAVSLKSAPPPPCAAAFVDLVRQALG